MTGTPICHCPVHGCPGRVVERDVRGHSEYCCDRCMGSTTLVDQSRAWLRVSLTAEQCRHVAELLRGGLTMHECTAEDLGPGGMP